MRIYYIIVSLLLLAASAEATSTAITSFLQSYNVSSSTISSLTSVNITYSGKTYTELFLNSNPYLLINTSNPSALSFVFRTSDIASIINNNTIASRIALLGLNSIASEMTSYLSSSNSSLNDCLTETGLDRATCTLGNYCNSCAIVPACNKVLFATGGPSDTFGEGIATFEIQYGALQDNESLFYSAVGNVSASTLLAEIGQINFAFSNISSITNSIYENAIFPPPPSVDLSQCNAIGSTTLNTSLSGAPWFCNAVGFCEFLTYNYTQLAVMQGLINTMNSNAPTASYVNSVASSINSTENGLITPLVVGKKTAQLDIILNTTLANYTTTVNRTQYLLSHLQNASLSASLATLESDYFSLLSGYLSINLTDYNSTLALDMAAVNSGYATQEPIYLRIIGMAKNNTALIIALQSNNDNPEVSALAFQEDQLNLQAGSGTNNPNAIMSNLSSVESQAKSLETIKVDPSNSARDTDGPFATSVAKLLGFSYPAAVASIPLFSSVQTLIIDGAIFVVIYAVYYTLRKENKLRVNRRTAKAWRDLFIIIFVIILIHLAVTYYFASEANSGAPIELFSSIAASAKSVGIVLNGTVTPGMTSCANILYNETIAAGKTPIVAHVSGNTCSINGTVSTAGACLNQFVFKGEPFVVLTNSNSSQLKAYSMYGTALYASGSDAFMTSCYPSFFLK